MGILGTSRYLTDMEPAQANRKSYYDFNAFGTEAMAVRRTGGAVSGHPGPLGQRSLAEALRFLGRQVAERVGGQRRAPLALRLRP
jgi:hypothetical protein